eukprot:TRINITY_DN2222_c1_g1_i1.p1 TRINITY_DN2222_c1_g1~~TRINITY_DN2222_c1_g1_i1.p1  ORF type:complete len:181 (+),score=38.39 TRINITY_DN2222_c1_g1_i1:40-582(+)
MVHELAMTPPQHPCWPCESTGSLSPADSTASESADGIEKFVPCCEHNNWDNVRVSKRMMTLRCRVCQGQWRAPVEAVWSKLRCPAYVRGCCNVDSCTLLHLNYRKQSLEARFKVHGESVIEHVRVGRAQEDVREKVESLRELARMTHDRSPSPTLSSASSGSTYTHDPYTWGSAAPPEFL